MRLILTLTILTLISCAPKGTDSTLQLTDVSPSNPSSSDPVKTPVVETPEYLKAWVGSYQASQGSSYTLTIDKSGRINLRSKVAIVRAHNVQTLELSADAQITNTELTGTDSDGAKIYKIYLKDRSCEPFTGYYLFYEGCLAGSSTSNLSTLSIIIMVKNGALYSAELGYDTSSPLSYLTFIKVGDL